MGLNGKKSCGFVKINTDINASLNNKDEKIGKSMVVRDKNS